MQTDNDDTKADSSGRAATAKTTKGKGGNVSRKRIRSDSVNGEEISKPPALPRPKGKISKASKRKPEGCDFSQPLEVLLESLPPGDKHKFVAADHRRKEDDRKIITAHSLLVDVRSEFRSVQSEMEEAQKAYDAAKALSQEHSDQDADNLLLEPNDWNNRFQQLKAYFEREGHSHIKKNINDADKNTNDADDDEFMSDAEAAETRDLSRWTSQQRKLKRSDELEHYKELLLNRLDFDWDPKTGHSPEKWLNNYNLLKEFKQTHDHVEVPMQYGEGKLGLWVKTQLTLYRNGNEGKLPALSAERIRMLEDLGITWGERRKVIPWNHRYQALLDYKKQFGNVHVPWQWKENVGLAQWVNTQRKKYKDLQAGRKNSLTDAQINILNSIGFKWSFGGKGRNDMDSPDNEQSSERADTGSAMSLGNPTYAVAGLAGHNGASSTTTSSAAFSSAMSLGNPKYAVAGLAGHNGASTTTTSSVPFSSTETEAAGTTAPSDVSMMAANNTQQSFAQSNQTHNGMVDSLSSNIHGNYMGSLYNDSFGANQHNVLGGLGTSQQVHNASQAFQNNDLSALPPQAWQHILNPQFIQPPSNNGIGAPPQFQQIFNNQPLLIQPPSYNMLSAPAQASQNDSSTLSQAYEHILNQQINQQMHMLPSNNFGAPQVSQNSLPVFSNTYQQLLNQQSIQPPSNAIGTPSQVLPQIDSSITANMYQQFLTQQTDQPSTHTYAGQKSEEES